MQNFIDKLTERLFQTAYSSTIHSRIVDFLVSNDIDKNNKINFYLDLGSGDGTLFQKVSSRMQPRLSLSSDVKPSGLPMGNHIILDLNKPLPFKDSIFSLVTCSSVIEHLYDTDNFICEVKRVLDKNGIFLLVANNISCWTNILALIFGRQPNVNHVSDYGDFGRFLQEDFVLPERDLRHRRVFSYAGLKRVLEFHGFKICAATRCIFYPFSGCVESLLEKLFKIYCAYIIILVRK